MTDLAQRHQTAPVLGDILRVKNLSDTHTISMAWDSRQYAVPPGGEGFIPFEAVKLYFGDPRSTEKIQSLHTETGVVSFIPDRATEVRRLNTLYGAPFGDESIVRGDVPSAEIHTLEGERITTVIEDPAGESTAPFQPTVSDNASLMAMIQRQQQHIELLMQKVGMGDAPREDEAPRDATPQIDGPPIHDAPPEDDGQ